MNYFGNGKTSAGDEQRQCDIRKAHATVARGFKSVLAAVKAARRFGLPIDSARFDEDSNYAALTDDELEGVRQIVDGIIWYRGKRAERA